MPGTPFTVNIPRIDFHPELFEKMIEERGVQVAWEKATLCPCVRADATDGTPSFNCGLCYNGNQYIDRLVLKAAITNISGQRNAQVFGELAVGGIFITVTGENRLGINDRITLLNQTMRYTELCEPPATKTKLDAPPGSIAITVDNTRKFPTPIANYCVVQIGTQLIRYTGKTATQLTGIPTSGKGAITADIPVGTSVQLMEWLLRYPPVTVFDARTQATALVEGTDFDIVDDRRIRLLTTAPLPRFTILYDAQPVYLVDSLSHEFRDQLLKLGQPGGQETLARLPVAAVGRRDFINRLG